MRPRGDYDDLILVVDAHSRDGVGLLPSACDQDPALRQMVRAIAGTVIGAAAILAAASIFV